MNERALTEKLTKALKEAMPNTVLFKHADGFTSGVPDISNSWYRITSWIEIKYLNPKLIHREVQHETMLRLERATKMAVYVLYDARTRRVRVSLPSDLHVREVYLTELNFEDHAGVADYIRNMHIQARSGLNSP